MDKPLKIGMVGLDTSHCPAFTGLLNDKRSCGWIHRAATG